MQSDLRFQPGNKKCTRKLVRRAWLPSSKPGSLHQLTGHNSSLAGFTFRRAEYSDYVRLRLDALVLKLMHFWILDLSFQTVLQNNPCNWRLEVPDYEASPLGQKGADTWVGLNLNPVTVRENKPGCCQLVLSPISWVLLSDPSYRWWLVTWTPLQLLPKLSPGFGEKTKAVKVSFRIYPPCLSVSYMIDPTHGCLSFLSAACHFCHWF